MDRLHSMEVFVRVAQHASFAAAARDLGLSVGAVSKQVTALEARIGTRLLDRTTRRVGLTEAGRVYLDRCLECLHALDDADASVTALAQAPKGLLRVAAPLDFREILMPVIADVMQSHAHIVVDLRLSNRVVDMVEEGVDVGVRVAPALDGRYVARPLALSRFAIFGARDYLLRHGRPQRPEDLARHRCIVFTEPRPMHELAFTRAASEVRVRLNSVMTSNDGEAVRLAALHGIGLAAMPSFLVHADLAAGQLEPVLLDWSLPQYRVFAVYPHRRFLSPKVKVFVEALQRAVGDGTRDPWWPEDLPAMGPKAGRTKRPRAS